MAEKLKSAEVGGRQAGYLFEFKSDGVYLTVYPADDSGIAFELSDMRQILKEYGVIDYDVAELALAVRAAEGTPVLLAKQYEASVESSGGKQPEALKAAVEGEEAEGAEDVKEVTDVVDNRTVMPFQIEVAKDRMSVTMKIDRQPGMVPPKKQDHFRY